MASKDLKKQVDYYSSLPYTLVIEGRDEHSDYCVASFAELPDLFMVGSTPEESIAELEGVKKDWIETYLELGNKMPVPLKLRKFSGNYLLRMQRSLHKALALHADLEGVSINQYAVSALSRAVGQEEVNQEKDC